MIRKRKLETEAETIVGESPNQCYCGELLLDKREATIQCQSCHSFYHSSCIKLIQERKLLQGDTFYEYQCGKCSPSESFVRLPIGW
jgi:hypothetical protein